jgi:hypothetical protein
VTSARPAADRGIVRDTLEESAAAMSALAGDLLEAVRIPAFAKGYPADRSPPLTIAEAAWVDRVSRFGVCASSSPRQRRN